MATASTDFLSCDGAELAYLATRRKDLAALMGEIVWDPGMLPGTLVCQIYGVTMFWDVAGGVRHAGNWPSIDIFNHEGDEFGVAKSITEAYAFLLARFW